MTEWRGHATSELLADWPSELSVAFVPSTVYIGLEENMTKYLYVDNPDNYNSQYKIHSRNALILPAKTIRGYVCGSPDGLAEAQTRPLEPVLQVEIWSTWQPNGSQKVVYPPLHRASYRPSEFYPSLKREEQLEMFRHHQFRANIFVRIAESVWRSMCQIHFLYYLAVLCQHMRAQLNPDYGRPGGDGGPDCGAGSARAPDDGPPNVPDGEGDEDDDPEGDEDDDPDDPEGDEDDDPECWCSGSCHGITSKFFRQASIMSNLLLFFPEVLDPFFGDGKIVSLKD